jgi:hypothetical protein
MTTNLYFNLKTGDVMVIYITTNLLNGKKYIGMDGKNNPKYLGSGTAIKNAIKKYGKNNFKKQIIEQCSSLQELIIREEYWLNYYDAGNNDNFYNMHNRSVGGHYSSNVIKEKTSKKKEKFWSIQIRTDVKKELNDYCRNNGYTVIDFVENIVRNHLSKTNS